MVSYKLYVDIPSSGLVYPFISLWRGRKNTIKWAYLYLAFGKRVSVCQHPISLASWPSLDNAPTSAFLTVVKLRTVTNSDKKICRLKSNALNARVGSLSFSAISTHTHS